jgi:predicted O-methyltransferase YrrM
MKSIEGYLYEIYGINTDQESPIQIAGFMRYRNLLRMFVDLGFTRGAEIGVAKGEFSLVMCRKIANLELLCIDPWEKYDYDRSGTAFWCNINPEEDHNVTLDNLSGQNVTILKMCSMEAIKRIPEGALDFVYIDANHYYEYVKQDLVEWGKRVRLGGVISGHDYLNNENCDVKWAVDEYVKENNVKKWFLTGDDTPSYFWERQLKGEKDE